MVMNRKNNTKNSIQNTRITQSGAPLDIKDLTQEIVENLKPLNPYKIILFGSYAYGNSTEDSDVDLYVVTNDDFIPKNWREKVEFKFKYFRRLEKISKMVGLDLIVHTKPMYEKFVQMNGSFAREILNKGIVLWEGN